MPQTMTSVRLTLPDDTLDRVMDAANAHQCTVETAAERILARAVKDLPLTGRAVVLSGEELARVETILGSGSVLNAQDLAQKIDRLAGVGFEHVRIQFTPGQLEDLARRAASNGITPRELIERTAPRIYEQFFNLLGGA